MKTSRLSSVLTSLILAGALLTNGCGKDGTAVANGKQGKVDLTRVPDFTLDANTWRAECEKDWNAAEKNIKARSLNSTASFRM
jgi:hypothetical protein